jgi:hypothetical protein
MLFADESVLGRSGCNVSCSASLSTEPTLESARATIIPCMGIVAGSMQTRGGFVFFMESSFAVTMWRLLGATVTSRAIFTSQDLLLCIGLSRGEPLAL